MLDSRYKFHASERYEFKSARMCIYDHTSRCSSDLTSGSPGFAYRHIPRKVPQVSMVFGRLSMSKSMVPNLNASAASPGASDERLVLQMLDHALEPDDASTAELRR